MRRSSSLAAALSELGLGAGDRVAINLPNRPEWIVALLACAKLGAVVVPVNPRLNYHELQVPAAARRGVRRVHRRAVRRHRLPAAVSRSVLAELPDLQYLVTVGDEELWYDDRIFQFEDLVSSGEGRAYPGAVVGWRRRRISALLYTSGTMGKPKGVRLSHRAVVETAVRTGEAIELAPDDRVLVALPLFAIFGFGVVVGPLAAGATLVLQEEFDAREAHSAPRTPSASRCCMACRRCSTC